MSLINFIKDVSRPIRHFFTFGDRKKAMKNIHSYDELKSRHLTYDIPNFDSEKKYKTVLYTCITGNYDQLIQPSFYNEDVKYICYTDNKEWIAKKQIGVWEIRDLVFKELNNALNNRWHKTHPHILFADYSESIYIDGNIDIKDVFLFSLINSRKDCKLLIPKHFGSCDIYQEVRKCKRYGKITKQQANNVVSFLKEKNYPTKYGLNENNLIYRKHNDEKVIELMENWWIMIRDFVPRDQLSLSYLLFESKITPERISIPNLRTLPEHFDLYFGDKHK